MEHTTVAQLFLGRMPIGSEMMRPILALFTSFNFFLLQSCLDVSTFSRVLMVLFILCASVSMKEEEKTRDNIFISSHYIWHNETNSSTVRWRLFVLYYFRWYGE